MGKRRQFHANLTSHNHAWLENEADRRETSMTDLLNEIIEESRKKSGTRNIPTPCVTSRVQ